MRKIYVVFLLILSLIIAPVAHAESVQEVEGFGIPMIFAGGVYYSRVGDLNPDGSLPYDPDEIERFGEHESDLGYIYAGAYWLPWNGWKLVPKTVETYSTRVVQEEPTPTVTPDPTPTITPKPVRRCPYCNHKIKVKRIKSHYKWCPRLH